MTLDRVTLTGADDSLAPDDLYDLTLTFPFVEWGILLSKEEEGKARNPSARWMQALAQFVARFQQNEQRSPRLSCHVCGQWVRDMLQGNPTLVEDRGHWLQLFQRLQINTHSQLLTYDREGFWRTLRLISAGSNHQVQQVIVQIDGVNEHLLYDALAGGFNAVPLFDTSHGKGITPSLWPRRIRLEEDNRPLYCGYAGGLGPDNLENAIRQIETVIHSEDASPQPDVPIWIDMETNVRSESGHRFDLEKVRACLETAKPFTRRPDTPSQR